MYCKFVNYSDLAQIWILKEKIGGGGNLTFAVTEVHVVHVRNEINE